MRVYACAYVRACVGVGVCVRPCVRLRCVCVCVCDRNVSLTITVINDNPHTLGTTLCSLRTDSQPWTGKRCTAWCFSGSSFMSNSAGALQRSSKCSRRQTQQGGKSWRGCAFSLTGLWTGWIRRRRRGAARRGEELIDYWCVGCGVEKWGFARESAAAKPGKEGQGERGGRSSRARTQQVKS